MIIEKFVFHTSNTHPDNGEEFVRYEDVQKRIAELEELLDEIHLDATFNLSEPPGYEVFALKNIITMIENFWPKSERGADE